MYRPHSEDPPIGKHPYGFRTLRCSHCGAWLVLRYPHEAPPQECSKCHNR